MKYLRGYRGVALLQILVCLGFIADPGGRAYGPMFGLINWYGAGVILVGSALAYVKPHAWILRMLAAAMAVLIVFNAVWFFGSGAFMTTGFPLIAYDLLFILVNLHFLGVLL